MSAKPGDELGSEAKWFGDDYDKNGLFGSTPPRFDGLRDELKAKGGDGMSDLDQQFHQFQDEGKRPTVAMETASTDDSMSGLFRKPMSDDGDLYTSLLSNQSFPSGQGAGSYLSDDMKSSKPATGSSSSSSQDHFSALDSYGIFGTSSNSNDKMPSNLCDLSDDLPKSLLGSEKTEAYNYMDISHGGDDFQSQGQRQGPLHSAAHTGASKVGSDLGSLGGYMDQRGRENDEEDEEEEEEEEEEEDNHQGVAGDSHSFPYVEEPSDEEMSDYRSYRNLGGTPQSASPVKITLTQSQAVAQPAASSLLQSQPPAAAGLHASDRENVLSVGLQGVPMVTLSEPEDDSPASSPNASPTEKVAPSRDMFGAGGGKSGAPGPGPGTRDQGSSAESGDSEIELVSEEPLRNPKPPGNTKTSSNPFDQPPAGNKAPLSQPINNNNPFDNSPAPKGGLGQPSAYSILREEREAELDSELFIESASEESPKREQGVGGPKAAVNAPSPLVPAPSPPGRTAGPAVAAVEPLVKPANDKDRSPPVVKVEEERPVKPKPPTAAVPPEVRADRPALDEDLTGGKGKMNASEGKGAAVPGFIHHGFDKQKAIDLLYWRNVKQSGAVFGSLLLLLFSLTQFSVVSVGAYLALAALSATISFRIYKSVLQAVQKTDEGHPFKSYLEVEIALSQDQIGKYADKALLYANTCMKELRRLFLVQDLIDSLKFAVLMWLLTYVGALFNGLTLLILAVVSMFTMPIVYEKHQAQIDQYVGLLRTQVNSVVGKIQAKIPGAKRKEE
ncbi:LOW QUALITY PROTEIN: reticulon-1a [Aplochiton taeniatus]